MFNPFKIFSLSEDSEWEVLSKRSSPRMSYADYAYMIKLLARSPWLYHYYPQLEDTVIKLAKTLEERKLLQKLFRKFRWVSNKENGNTPSSTNLSLNSISLSNIIVNLSISSNPISFYMNI